MISNRLKMPESWSAKDWIGALHALLVLLTSYDSIEAGTKLEIPPMVLITKVEMFFMGMLLLDQDNKRKSPDEIMVKRLALLDSIKGLEEYRDIVLMHGLCIGKAGENVH